MRPQSSITPDIPLSPFAGEAPDMFFGLPMAMARAMALRGERIGNDMAQVRLGFQPDLTNSRGDVHGGSIATLLDCTLAAAVRSHDPAAYGVATIDLTLHFVTAAFRDRCRRRPDRHRPLRAARPLHQLRARRGARGGRHPGGPGHR